MPRLERKMHENSRGVGGGEVLGGAAPSPSAILGQRCKVLQRDMGGPQPQWRSPRPKSNLVHFGLKI